MERCERERERGRKRERERKREIFPSVSVWERVCVCARAYVFVTRKVCLFWAYHLGEMCVCVNERERERIRQRERLRERE